MLFDLPLQMCADGGVLSDAALRQLADAAYSSALLLEGGYAGWSEVGSCRTRRCKVFDAVVHVCTYLEH